LKRTIKFPKKNKQKNANCANAPLHLALLFPIEGHHFNHKEFRTHISLGGKRGANHKMNFIPTTLI
jgi:hypothetical protein